jgi:hypothetical protein
MTQSRRPSPVAAFFGWLLMCGGALVAVTTGACTVYFLAAPILQGGGLEYFGGLLSWVMLVMIIGGIPCLIGVGMFFLGRFIARKGEARQLPPRRVEDLDDQP